MRYVAPAGFLLAVTLVALVLRGGLQSEAPPAKAHPARRAEASSIATRAKPAPPKRWYVIQSGDTLGAIAARYGTTVDSILHLNPGVVPTALTPDTQLRIR